MGAPPSSHASYDSHYHSYHKRFCRANLGPGCSANAVGYHDLCIELDLSLSSNLRSHHRFALCVETLAIEGVKNQTLRVLMFGRKNIVLRR